MPLDWMDVQAAGAEPEEPRPELPAADVEAVLADLTDEQRRAVVHAEGPLLILAGAGSGKTRVITRRIAWLVATGRARPHEILALTFTNKAAGEMRRRCERFFPVKGLWIGTFHAMCARILRREAELLGGWTRDFSIYDTAERNQLIKELVKDLGFDPQRFRAGAIGAWISARKNRGRPGEAEEESSGPRGAEAEVYARVEARYEEALRTRNAFDFDDLLLKVLALFDQHPGVRDAYAYRFRYVLVDEYQDTNHVQYLLTRHLASVHGNLTVCGDPDQSIYAWRGADIENILDFERDFAGARGVDVVKLERNYRSTACILAAAHGLIRHNLARKEKELWTEKQSERKVKLLVTSDENDEARAIATEIRALLTRGFRADGVAIFYRANFMQRALELALRLAGLPYQIVGGVEFYQRREVRDLVSYLRVMVNARDDAACERVLNVPARGLGEKSVAELVGFARARELSLAEAALRPEAGELLRGRARGGLEEFAALLASLKPFVDGPATAALEAVIRGTDYFAHLASSDEANQEMRIENVEELLAGARQYDLENPAGKLRGYLEEVALVSDVDAFEEGSERVTLMTLHSSKGLEFPAVFVAGLEEGLLPHALALEDDFVHGLEEERRLLYVGMTRAMDELCLSRAEVRLHFGQATLQAPSRFLAEIPAECLEAPPDPGAMHVREGPVFVPDEEELGTFELGARVEHDHFGYGVVERLQGSGASTRVTVRFSGAGTRILLLQYAKLRVVQR